MIIGMSARTLVWCAALVAVASSLELSHETYVTYSAKAHNRRRNRPQAKGSMQPIIGFVEQKSQTRGKIKIPLRLKARTREEEDRYFSKLHEHHMSFMTEEGRAKMHHHKRRSGSSKYKVHLTDINNSQFVGEIQVGSPGQTFGVIFDTGSSNLWINGDACTDEACEKHRRFKPSDSKSFSMLDMDMDVMFGTGQITGSLATDTFRLGADLMVKNQTFGMINSEKGEVFSTGAFDGILGLSFPALSAASYTPVFDNIMKQNLLDHNTFSFYYSRLPAQESAILFGEPPPEYHTGEIEFVDVSQEVYWELKLKDVLVGGKAMNLCPDGPCKIVVDTGTSLLTGPSPDIATLVSEIGASYKCSDTSGLPTLTYVLQDDNGDHSFDLEPRHYIVSSDQSDDDGDGSKFCHPGFMALDVPQPRGPLWILGDVFMQKFFTVFQREPSRVGFAPARPHASRPSGERDEELSR